MNQEPMNGQAGRGLGAASGSARTATVWHDGTWNRDELLRMAKGERIDRNGKRYGMCSGCRIIVRLDKPIFGSLHLCE
jgi:hypothetical protein